MSTVYDRLNKKQKEQTAKILQSLKKTGKALAISPTGTGKTTLITNVIKAEVKGPAKALVLIHRTEQLQQVKARIEANCPGITVTEFSGQEKDLSGKVVIASIQTLSRPNNLAKIKSDLFSIMLVDEVHHAPAESWSNVITYFRNCKKVGFTATPTRPDGLPLAEMFGEPSTQTFIREAVELKIFANPESLVTLTTSAIEGVVGKNGDYKASELERLATFAPRNQQIVKTYLGKGRAKLKDLGLKPKTICFCVNSNHALIMKEAFVKNGVKADILVSNPKFVDQTDRQMIFQQFKDTHELEVICVVDLFNEAIDLPNVTCVIMARPTRSVIIYTQQMGRAARFLDGSKESFVVLDFSDNSRKGFQPYNSSNITRKGITMAQINMEFVEGIDDPIVLQERIDALTVIDDFMTARAEFYPTKEEACEACRKLGITSRREYNTTYKQDPRLPSDPHGIYKNWSFKDILGLSRTYLKLINLMPKNVEFKKGQKWNKTTDKYIFIDKEYGEFVSTPHRLMSQSWKAGVSGHPRAGRVRTNEGNEKPVLCLTNNTIYPSGKRAGEILKCNFGGISNVLNKKSKTTGGYTFRYLTPEELTVYKAKQEGKNK